MPEAQSSASDPKLLAAPPGIDVSLCSFRGLQAFQTLSKRYNWHVQGQTAFSTADERPGLWRKYEWLITELYELTFPERKGLPYATHCAYKLLGAIETSILLYYQIEDLKAKAIPPRTREGVYKFMRFHNIFLADYALEAPKMAMAFKGFHYGVENIEKLSTKLDVIRVMYKELRCELSKLEDAWKLCMEDLGVMARSGGIAETPEQTLREQWGGSKAEILDSLVAKFGIPTKSEDYPIKNSKTDKKRDFDNRAIEKITDLDEFARQIYFWWFFGDGKNRYLFNGDWGNYMMANESLRIQLLNRVLTDANKRRNEGFRPSGLRKIEDSFHAELEENGYYKGYGLLHGTDKTKGNFYYIGTVDVIGEDGKNATLCYNITYLWNDRMNANTNYWTDTYWRILSTVLAGILQIDPKDFDIQIGWKSKGEIKFVNGLAKQQSGYPFERSVQK